MTSEAPGPGWVRVATRQPAAASLPRALLQNVPVTPTRSGTYFFPFGFSGLPTMQWKGPCVTLHAGVTKGCSLKGSCEEPPRERSADGHRMPRGARCGHFLGPQAASPLLPAGSAAVSMDGSPDNCRAEVTSPRGPRCHAAQNSHPHGARPGSRPAEPKSVRKRVCFPLPSFAAMRYLQAVTGKRGFESGQQGLA